jgi:hypothetical protein
MEMSSHSPTSLFIITKEEIGNLNSYKQVPESNRYSKKKSSTLQVLNTQTTCYYGVWCKMPRRSSRIRSFLSTKPGWELFKKTQ